VILICYDGSADAQAALDQAARLTPGATATILTVWEPLIDIMARAPGGGWVYPADAGEFDRQSEASARGVAEEGVRRATELGLRATARTSPRRFGYDGAILDEAQAAGADAIVMGTRGRSGLKSALLGSVSHDVVQHADRPVVVVPSSALAERRAEQRARDRDTSSAAPAEGDSSTT